MGRTEPTWPEELPAGAASRRDITGSQLSGQMFRYTSLCQQGPWRMRTSSNITRIPVTRQNVVARMTLSTAEREIHVKLMRQEHVKTTTTTNSQEDENHIPLLTFGLNLKMKKMLYFMYRNIVYITCAFFVLLVFCLFVRFRRHSPEGP